MTARKPAAKPGGPSLAALKGHLYEQGGWPAVEQKIRARYANSLAGQRVADRWIQSQREPKALKTALLLDEQLAIAAASDRMLEESEPRLMSVEQERQVKAALVQALPRELLSDGLALLELACALEAARASPRVVARPEVGELATVLIEWLTAVAVGPRTPGPAGALVYLQRFQAKLAGAAKRELGNDSRERIRAAWGMTEAQQLPEGKRVGFVAKKTNIATSRVYEVLDQLGLKARRKRV